jgi:hypothetical protein
MSITHTIGTTWENGTAGVSTRKQITSDSEINVDVVIASATTNGQIVCAIDISELKSIVLNSTKDVTVKTNDGSSPDDTFTLKANNPLVWNSESPTANPFSADITDLYVTNASGADATVQVRALLDVTP